MMKTFGFTKRLMILIAVITVVSVTSDFRYGLEAEESFVNFTGKVVKITGDVDIRRAGEKEWIDAEHGMELAVEDQIKTGIESSVDLIFTRDTKRSKIRVLEEADMSLMALNLDKVTGASEILLDLAIGHIIIKTAPLKGESRFEVLTPTSMTAVRGTGFEIKVVREEKGPLGNADIIQ